MTKIKEGIYFTPTFLIRRRKTNEEITSICPGLPKLSLFVDFSHITDCAFQPFFAFRERHQHSRWYFKFDSLLIAFVELKSSKYISFAYTSVPSPILSSYPPKASPPRPRAQLNKAIKLDKAIK